MFSIEDRFYSIEEVIEIMLRGGYALYVYGTVFYKDTFGEMRETEFCYHFVWGSKGIPMWMHHSEHTKAT
jgi:hypothetical protein